MTIAIVLATGTKCTVEPPLRSSGKVIYGSDDRVEAFSVNGLEEAIPLAVALVDDALLTEDGGFDAPTLVEAYGVCPDEAFAEQPVLGRCSGIFVDRDLVLTAGHCIRTAADCASTRIVRGFETGITAFDRAEIHQCEEIAYRSLNQSTDFADWAFVRVSPALPEVDEWPSLRPVAPPPGSRLTVLGHPSGLPMKADESALFVEFTTRNTLRLAADTYEGSSGSPVFSEGALLAMLVSGASDWELADGCRVSRILDESNAAEEAVLVESALEELCASGWPSVRLCDRSPSCGDLICSADEATTCPSDCEDDSPRCGDGVCEPGDCESDCRVGTRPPASWICSDSTWDSRDGCDCECGAVDPDCETALTTYNCAVGEVCSASGECVPEAVGVPDDWICNEEYYGSNDGCDCACGVRDPDCDDPQQEIVGCATDSVCGPNGECLGNPEVPETWTCSPGWYAAGDDCDCSCGAWDPDCADSSLPVLGCEEGESCSIAGVCEVLPALEPPLGHGCSVPPSHGSPCWLASLAIVALLRRRSSPSCA